MSYRRNGYVPRVGYSQQFAEAAAVVFPPDATHVYKLGEATGAGDRVDSVGALDMSVTGGSMTQVTGYDGFGQQGDGAGYMETAQFAAPDDFTFAVWCKRPDAGQHVHFGVRVAFVFEAQISTDGTALTLSMKDPGGAFLSAYSFSSTQGTDWLLAIARIHNTAKTGAFRHYGGQTGNGSDVALGGTWNIDTKYDSIADELVWWDRYLTDDECDALGSGLVYA
jgi:hypothetical protein